MVATEASGCESAVSVDAEGFSAHETSNMANAIKSRRIPEHTIILSACVSVAARVRSVRVSICMKLVLSLLAPVLLLAGTPWNIRALSEPPKVYPAQTAEPGVRAMYFEAVPWKGKPTRVFAYYGTPEGKKLPAMVLIHGGGGTAFAEWVRLWNKRGYAAIAMDTVGTVPDKADDGKLWAPVRKRHEYGGPAGWGDFGSIDEPITDQWSYHAVAAAVLAHSLIRSFPEVDPKRIGVTGISWGGYLTSIVSGVDPRFRFAAPVYGCGFLGRSFRLA